MGKDYSSIFGALPPEIYEQLTKEEQVIKIRLEKRKFGKEVTIIEGVDEKEFDLKKKEGFEIEKKLSDVKEKNEIKNKEIALKSDILKKELAKFIEKAELIKKKNIEYEEKTKELKLKIIETEKKNIDEVQLLKDQIDMTSELE